jgi:hypothetical protein
MTKRNAVFDGAKPRPDALLDARSAMARATFVTAPDAGDVDSEQPINDPTKPYAPADYEATPDETVECPECQKMNDDDSIYCGQCGFKLEGATGVVVNDGPTADETGDETDSSDTDPAANAAKSRTKLAADDSTNPADPPTNVVDDQGNVADDAICGDTACAHLGSLHEDEDAGMNTGKCTTPDCVCQAFVVDDAGTASNTGDADTDGIGGGPDNADASQAIDALSDLAPIDSPSTVPADTITSGSDDNAAELPELAPPGSNPPPPLEPLTLGSPFYGCVIIEGQETEDGRGLADASGDLDVANGIPLMLLATQTHDPMGWDLNDPAVWSGRIAGLERSPGAAGTSLVWFWGNLFANNEAAAQAEQIISGMGGAGMSADVIVTETIQQLIGMDDWDWPIYKEVITKYKLSGATIVPSPAFGTNTWIAMGEKPETFSIDVEAPNQPESVPPMSDEAAVVAAAFRAPKFHDEALCVPCGDSSHGFVASAAPVRPSSDWFANPGFHLGDDRLIEIFTGRGEKRYGGRFACPLTITEDGRVFGHIAPWGVCHTGNRNSCQTAPHSAVDYAHFMRAGQTVLCDDGTEVTVGTLTFNGPHASLDDYPADAMAHYDNTTTAWAHVVAYDDDFGIAVAGAVLPHITEEDLRVIRGATASGDWRMMGGNYELVGVLMVNNPGFPIAQVASDRGSLVAAGAYELTRVDVIDEPIPEFEDTALRAFLLPLFKRERETAAKTIADLAKEAANKKLQRLKSRK